VEDLTVDSTEDTMDPVAVIEYAPVVKDEEVEKCSFCFVLCSPLFSLSSITSLMQTMS
jgi:hypothetical protein